MSDRIEDLFDANRIDTMAKRVAKLSDEELADLPSAAVDLCVDALSQCGRAMQAGRLFERAQDAGHTLALPLACAQALFEAGNTKRAKGVLRNWRAPEPLRPPPFVAQAQALMRFGEWSAALQVLRPVAATFPDNALLARLIGQCALWDGHRKAAQEALEQAAALDPAQPAWVWRALAALNGRRMETGGLSLTLPAQKISPATIAGLASGQYERHEREAALADLRDGDRVLELGAGIGAMAMWISQARPDLSVTCVEGNPELAPLILQNFEVNRCGATLIEGLAALHEGEQTFYVSGDFWASSTRQPDAGAQAVRLPCIDVRRLLAETHPTILIVDIEGAEAEILPALDLSGVRRVIVEVHPKLIDPPQVSKVLHSLFQAGFDIDLTRDRGDVYVFDRAAPEGHDQSD